MEDYKKEFIEFMIDCEVLKFGDFVTKSGRKTPFFVNTGFYRTGAQLRKLGEYYAKDVLGTQDMIGIAYFYAGSRSFYTNKPINALSDIKGWKIRVPESPIFMGLCDSFGCAGTPMSVGELYTALQTGVVDGAENAPIFYYQQKHFEAAPYLTMTEHIMTPDIVVMSKSYLESLPQEYQDAIIQAGKANCGSPRKRTP